jgi:AcrR family transcriptional regulator
MSKPIPSKASSHDVIHVAVPASPRKRPRQGRSIALVDALKAAGWDILEKERREALSVWRLSERSGVAVSSIYEYFPTMESLIAAIFEDYRSRLRRELLENIRALPPTARLFDGILLALRSGMAALHKWSMIDSELSVKSAYFDELVRLDLVKPKNFWSAFVIPALLERFPDEVTVHDRDKAAFLAHQAILTLPRAVVLERPEYLADDDTAMLLARMVHALLTANPE